MEPPIIPTLNVDGNEASWSFRQHLLLMGLFFINAPKVDENSLLVDLHEFRRNSRMGALLGPSF
jgi:hypothetical protein